LKSIRDIKYQNTPTGAVGYIRLNQFKNAARNARRNQRFRKKQVAGYILDLRSNPGGLLFSSVEIAQVAEDGTLSQLLTGREKKTLKVQPPP